MSTNLFLELGEDSPLARIKTYFDALQHSADEYLFVVDVNTKQVMLSKNFVRDFNFFGMTTARLWKTQWSNSALQQLV